MTNGFVGHISWIFILTLPLTGGCIEEIRTQGPHSGMAVQKPGREAPLAQAHAPKAATVEVVHDDAEVDKVREQVRAFVERLDNKQSGTEAEDHASRSSKAIRYDGRKMYPLEDRTRKTYPLKPKAFTGVDERQPTTARDDVVIEVDGEVVDPSQPGASSVAPNVALSVNDSAEPSRKQPRIMNVSFRVPDRVQPPTPTGDAPTTNRSVAKVTLEVNASVADYIEELVRLTNAEPTNVADRWRLALMYMVTGEDERAVSVFESLPEETAMMMTRGMDLMSALKTAAMDPARGVDGAFAAADRLQQMLANKASLEIPAVKLCSRVQAFAVYEELPTGVFRPGVSNQAILYYEVENFATKTESDGQFRSMLSSQVEIMSPQGDVLWRKDEPRIEDVSRRPRRDFFVAQRIVIPATLGDGEYVLKLTVEDKLAGKRTQAVERFAVGTAMGEGTAGRRHGGT